MISVIEFPELVNLALPFLIHNKCWPTASRDTRGIDNYSPLLAYAGITLSPRIVFLFLCLTLHSKTTNRKFDCSYIFSIAVHVFRNLFLKICPLFGQILIACLKCSRASFSPSSHSEKMHWGRGCPVFIISSPIISTFILLIPLKFICKVIHLAF